MAVVLKSFPATTSAGRPQKYPWDQWQDGRTWKAKTGADFDLPPERFRAILYQRARNTGMTCRTQVDGDFVLFQFQRPKKPRD